MSDRLLTLGVGLLLLGTPWHELVVHLWKPLGAWDEAVLLGLLVLLAVRGRRAWKPCPFLPPLLALAAASLLSAGAHGSSAWPLRAWVPYAVAGLAACQLPRAQARLMVRCLLVMGALAALYGIVTFLAFHLAGGALRYRPPLDGMPLALVYPYYSGAVPRSAHLVGPFMNDVYFGVWSAALVGLLLAVAGQEGWRRGSILSGLLLGLATAWSLSRSAWLALGAVLGYLGLRRDPRFLLLLVPALVAAVPMATGFDRLRFLAPTSGPAWSPGRFAMATRALDTLAAGSLLGAGPGAVRLADTQFAKVVIETGWAGALALAWLLVALVRPAWGPARGEVLGLSAAILALLVLGFSGELFEVPQVALTLWILAGLREALQPGPSAPPA